MSISSLVRLFSSLICISAMFAISPVYAASSNHPAGLTGTMTSGSAEVMEQGSVRYFMMSGVDDFFDPSGNGEKEIRLLSGMTFGVSNKLEAGVALSLAHNSATIATGTGLRNIRGHAKYHFYGSRAQGKAAAFSIYATGAELVGTPGLASGESNSGVEVVYSSLGIEGDNHYALELGHRDYKSYSGGSFIYNNVPVVALSASHLFRTDLHRNYELGIKGESVTLSDTAYNNVYLSLAAHFATDQELSYLVGTLQDISGGNGANRARYYLGFTYTNKYPRNLGMRHLNTMKSPEPVKLAMSPPPAAKVPEPVSKPVIQGCRAYVEIMDLSGLNGLAEQVTAKMKQDGYCIRAVHKEENSQAYYSHLYYALDKGELAVEMARVYKIQGEVSRRRLPADVDIRFILGSDQR